MQFQVVNNLKEFEKLRSDWDTLVFNADEENIYVSYVWIHSILSNLPQEQEIYFFCCWDNANLIGVLPFIRYTVKTWPGVKLNCYRNCRGPYTAYFDLPILNKSKDLLITIWDSFILGIEKWDIFEFGNVRENTLIEHLHSYVSLHKEKVHIGSDIVYQMQGSWDDYYNKIPKNLKKNYKQIKNRLNKCEHYEVITVNKVEDVEYYYKKAKEIEGKSWKGNENSLRTEQHEDYLVDFMKSLLKEHTLIFLFLKINHEYVSFCICPVINKFAASMIKGYNQDFKYYSPGLFLSFILIESCHTDKIRNINVYHGNHSIQKRLAISEPKDKYIIRFFNRTPSVLYWKSIKYIKRKYKELKTIQLRDIK